MAMFNMALSMSVNFAIPLVVWGENSAFEYGSDEEKYKGFKLDVEWIKNYGVTQNTLAGDWISDDLTRKELTPYFGPSNEETGYPLHCPQSAVTC